MRIYVGNLSYQSDEESVREAFTVHGQVDSVSIIKDKASGQSKGFGFVEMPNSSEAQSAIEALNGTELQGRRLNVNEARPMTDRRDSGGGGRGGFGGGGGGGGGRGGFGGGGGGGGGRGGRGGGGGGRW